MQGREEYIAWVREGHGGHAHRPPMCGVHTDGAQGGCCGGGYWELRNKLGRRRRWLETLVRQKMASSSVGGGAYAPVTGRSWRGDFPPPGASWAEHKRSRDTALGIAPTRDRHLRGAWGNVILLGATPRRARRCCPSSMAIGPGKGRITGGLPTAWRPSWKNGGPYVCLAVQRIPWPRLKRGASARATGPGFSEAANLPITSGQRAGPSHDAARGSSVEISPRAMGHGLPDRLRGLCAAASRPPACGISDGHARFTAVSQALKPSRQNTKLRRLVALAHSPGRRVGFRKAKKKRTAQHATMYAFKESGPAGTDANVAFLGFPSEMGDNDSVRFFRIAKKQECRGLSRKSWPSGATSRPWLELRPEPDRSVARELSSGTRRTGQPRAGAGRRIRRRGQGWGIIV